MAVPGELALPGDLRGCAPTHTTEELCTVCYCTLSGPFWQGARAVVLLFYRAVSGLDTSMARFLFSLRPGKEGRRPLLAGVRKKAKREVQER